MKKANVVCCSLGRSPPRLWERVTPVLQQHKEGSGEEGSRTLHFIQKQFHPHATDLDLFVCLFSCVGLHFPNYSSYDKQGNLN